MKSYRGKGLVKQIFDKTQQYLVERGIENYLLEVLSDNTAAIKLYSRLGFETVREFTCHVQACSAISRNSKMCRIDHVELEQLDGNIQIYKDLPPDFTPSWQNSQESISRAGDAISVVAAKHNGELCGFIAYDPQQGDLTQIVVSQDCRGEGIGSLLFDYFLAHNKADIVKALNVDVNCESLRYFLESKNLNISSRQFEMIKKL